MMHGLLVVCSYQVLGSLWGPLTMAINAAIGFMLTHVPLRLIALMVALLGHLLLTTGMGRQNEICENFKRQCTSFGKKLLVYLTATAISGHLGMVWTIGRRLTFAAIVRWFQWLMAFSLRRVFQCGMTKAKGKAEMEYKKGKDRSAEVTDAVPRGPLKGGDFILSKVFIRPRSSKCVNVTTRRITLSRTPVTITEIAKPSSLLAKTLLNDHLLSSFDDDEAPKNIDEDVSCKSIAKSDGMMDQSDRSVDEADIKHELNCHSPLEKNKNLQNMVFKDLSVFSQIYKESDMEQLNDNAIRIEKGSEHMNNKVDGTNNVDHKTSGDINMKKRRNGKKNRLLKKEQIDQYNLDECKACETKKTSTENMNGPAERCRELILMKNKCDSYAKSSEVSKEHGGQEVQHRKRTRSEILREIDELFPSEDEEPKKIESNQGKKKKAKKSKRTKTAQSPSPDVKSQSTKSICERKAQWESSQIYSKKSKNEKPIQDKSAIEPTLSINAKNGKNKGMKHYKTMAESTKEQLVSETNECTTPSKLEENLLLNVPTDRKWNTSRAKNGTSENPIQINSNKSTKSIQADGSKSQNGSNISLKEQNISRNKCKPKITQITKTSKLGGLNADITKDVGEGAVMIGINSDEVGVAKKQAAGDTRGSGEVLVRRSAKVKNTQKKRSRSMKSEGPGSVCNLETNVSETINQTKSKHSKVNLQTLASTQSGNVVSNSGDHNSGKIKQQSGKNSGHIEAVKNDSSLANIDDAKKCEGISEALELQALENPGHVGNEKSTLVTNSNSKCQIKTKTCTSGDKRSTESVDQTKAPKNATRKARKFKKHTPQISEN